MLLTTIALFDFICTTSSYLGHLPETKTATRSGTPVAVRWRVKVFNKKRPRVCVSPVVEVDLSSLKETNFGQ